MNDAQTKMLAEYAEKIEAARVYDVAVVTPLEAMPQLSEQLHNKILLKREDLQSVFSFKLRGAYNRMCQLTVAERAAGVVAASAGNHAQGVALSAKRLGANAVIVMPTTTPAIKVDAVRRLGGEVVLAGESYDGAYQHARDLAERDQRTLIHPYDDPEVIAGQGTIGKEILAQYPEEITAIFIPVGGGGLIAGVAAYVKHHRPEIKIIGVEAEDSACLHAALAAGERVVLDEVGLFADGTAVKQIGEEPFRVVRDLVDSVVTVSSDEICAAIMDIFQDTRGMSEPSGALAVAGAKQYSKQHGLQNKTFITINSGANVNLDRLRHMAERAEVGSGKEVLLAVTIDETQGSFRQFCNVLAARNITEFNYRYADGHRARIFVGVRTVGGSVARQDLLTSLDEAGYHWVDLTDDEMARAHVRYMVGGHAPEIEDEQLYRFEFPERPGALLRFLTRMGERWNISLFHYRNHGAAYGRVLVGVQVAEKESVEFENFLESLGYRYQKETTNPAYQLFLK